MQLVGDGDLTTGVGETQFRTLSGERAITYTHAARSGRNPPMYRGADKRRAVSGAIQRHTMPGPRLAAAPVDRFRPAVCLLATTHYFGVQTGT